MSAMEDGEASSSGIAIEVVNWLELVRSYGQSVRHAFAALIVKQLRHWDIRDEDIIACDSMWFARTLPGRGMVSSDPLVAEALLEASLMASPMEIDGIRVALVIRVTIGPWGHFDLFRNGMAHRREGLPYSNDLIKATHFLDSVAQGRIHLAFQTISDIRSGETMYHEILLRDAPGGSSTEPSIKAVIESVERVGLALRVDQSVLRTACSILSAQPGLRLGCNVSASSLVPSPWWELLLRKLVRRPGIAKRLVIEVTETAVVRDEGFACQLLHRLRDAGCTIAIDDFGSGRTSMTFVMAVRPDIVKFDRSFLVAAREDVRRRELLRNLVAACRSIEDCRVIAEGVETLEDCHIVVNAGFTGAQGFLLHCPSVQMSWARTPCVLKDVFAVPRAAHRQAAARRSTSSGSGISSMLNELDRPSAVTQALRFAGFRRAPGEDGPCRTTS